MEAAVAVIVVMLLLLHPATSANNASALLPASAKTNAMLVLITFPFFSDILILFFLQLLFIFCSSLVFIFNPCLAFFMYWCKWSCSFAREDLIGFNFKNILMQNVLQQGGDCFQNNQTSQGQPSRHIVLSYWMRPVQNKVCGCNFTHHQLEGSFFGSHGDGLCIYITKNEFVEWLVMYSWCFQSKFWCIHF